LNINRGEIKTKEEYSKMPEVQRFTRKLKLERVRRK